MIENPSKLEVIGSYEKPRMTTQTDKNRTLKKRKDEHFFNKISTH